MIELKNQWKLIVAQGLSYWASKAPGGAITAETLDPGALLALVQIETPPNSDLGDLALPLFPFAKSLKKSPPQIALALASLFQLDSAELSQFVESIGQSKPELAPVLKDFKKGSMGSAEAAGPYLNIRFNKPRVIESVLSDWQAAGESWGTSALLTGQRILIEFSSPNTNKPLHLGHLRNNALGEATSRILKAAGAEVKKVDLFNDRGIHICKSMVAYQRWGNMADPTSLRKKSDHYVAELYVRYQSELKQQIAALKSNDAKLAQLDDDAIWMQTEIGSAAQVMLVQWEAEDPAIRALWKKMNTWAIDGIMETYRKTGVSFDWIQYEHETYLQGKEEVLKGLSAGTFFKRPDGAIAVELPWKDGTKTATDDEPVPYAQKVLLRADGTSIYLTQDLGTAIKRHEVWPFDQAVYVVANEQDYHFTVLFAVLKILGYEWADKLFHLSYGLVNLPTGRMKTREGTVVDADDLLDELARGAAKEIREKGREGEVGDIEVVSYKVALAALHYFLLQTSPAKDMIFNPEESLSFAGNTGPYLQYMGARICSLLRKWGKDLPDATGIDASLLCEEQAWELVRLVADWPTVVEQAALNKDPSRITAALYELAKSFGRFYHDLPVLTAETSSIVEARIVLSAAVLQVLKHGFSLANIPFLEAM